jgi:hypothetical protein
MIATSIPNDIRFCDANIDDSESMGSVQSSSPQNEPDTAIPTILGGVPTIILENIIFPDRGTMEDTMRHSSSLSSFDQVLLYPTHATMMHGANSRMVTQMHSMTAFAFMQHTSLGRLRIFFLHSP